MSSLDLHGYRTYVEPTVKPYVTRNIVDNFVFIVETEVLPFWGAGTFLCVEKYTTTFCLVSEADLSKKNVPRYYIEHARTLLCVKTAEFSSTQLTFVAVEDMRTLPVTHLCIQNKI